VIDKKHVGLRHIIAALCKAITFLPTKSD